MITYTMNWYDWQGNLMTCTIYDVLSTDTTATTLTPGATPFAIRSQTDEDVLRPVRYTTATINVLCGYSDILPLDNSNKYRVVLQKAGSVVWLGWIASDIMTQAMSSQDEEFTYNAVDDLGFMQSCNFSTDMGATPSIGEIFQECRGNFLNKGASASQYLYIGNGFPTIGGSIANTFNIIVNISNYVQTYKDAEGNLTESQSPLLSFLQDYMALTGCTITSNGVNWYICSPVDTLYAGAIAMDDAFETNIQSASFANSFTSVNIDTLNPFGEHTISIQSQYKKISIQTGNSNDSENTLPALSAELMTGNWYDAPIFKYYGDSSEYSSNPQTIGWEAYNYISNPANGITLYRYNLVQDGSVGYATLGTAIDESTIAANYSTGQNCLWAYGACFLKEDYYVDPIYTSRDNGTWSDGKYNYDFSDRVYLVQCQFSGTGVQYQRISGSITYTTQPRLDDLMTAMMTDMLARMNKPVLHLESKENFLASGGGFCITFNSWTGRANPANALYALGPMKAFSYITAPTSGVRSLVFVCKMQIGHFYWDGSGWVQTESYFYIRTQQTSSNTEMSEVVNTKVLQDAFTCTGYAMANPASGYITFEIYGVGLATYETTNYTGTLDFPDMVMLEDLQIEYCEPLENYLEKREDELESSNTNNIGEETYSVESTLCSAYNTTNRTGSLYYRGHKLPALSAVDYTGYPEIITLSRAEGLLYKSQKIMKLTIQQAALPTMAQRISYNGDTWVLHSIGSYDLTTGRITVNYLLL